MDAVVALRYLIDALDTEQLPLVKAALPGLLTEIFSLMNKVRRSSWPGRATSSVAGVCRSSQAPSTRHPNGLLRLSSCSEVPLSTSTAAAAVCCNRQRAMNLSSSLNIKLSWNFM